MLISNRSAVPFRKRLSARPVHSGQLFLRMLLSKPAVPISGWAEPAQGARLLLGAGGERRSCQGSAATWL